MRVRCTRFCSRRPGPAHRSFGGGASRVLFDVSNPTTGVTAMGNSKLIGLVLLVVGIALLYFGYQSSQSVGEQVSETLTGRFTDETTWYLIGGAAAAVAGAYITFMKK